MRPNGTLVPLRSYQALGTLELHATPKLDIYAYVGGEYLRRASYINPINGVVVGYGSNAFSNKGCNTETLPSSGNTALTSINLSGGTAAPTKTGLSPTAYNGFLPGALGSCTADTRNILKGLWDSGIGSIRDRRAACSPASSTPMPSETLGLGRPLHRRPSLTQQVLRAWSLPRSATTCRRFVAEELQFRSLNRLEEGRSRKERPFFTR